MSNIHPTAIVDPRAQLAGDVRVEAYAVIGAGVIIGPGSVVFSHSILQGPTRIGANCQIGPAAYVGLDPQHLHFLSQTDRPPTWLVVGDRTIIRETATLHRSTKAGEENATRVGHDCLVMASAHVAHDCRIGNHVTLANAVMMGGHCQVGDRVFLGGGCGVHQFTRIGRLAIISGNEAVSRDVPPFAATRYGGLKGYNAIGCRRSGLSHDALKSIRQAYYCIHTNRTTRRIVKAIEETVPQTAEVRELVDFMSHSKRGMQPSIRFIRSFMYEAPEG
ncbi:MAG TPA: acyl-ACP--UDP-N-acetylglucosamine O-acyltransferase [Tepidisphaeraceae bacterium]|jgi:UDP-N-acetylglucosamine acyltransferase|nr:acyl-ACP--UDP-N-acetylglucosamine O-acyltransferase [Tepidisphaeraceae bacterium]